MQEESEQTLKVLMKSVQSQVQTEGAMAWLLGTGIKATYVTLEPTGMRWALFTQHFLDTHPKLKKCLEEAREEIENGK